jgi:hypothetical protein
MSRQFGEKFEPKHFTQLPAYETLVKVDQHTFTMSALPPEWEQEGFSAPDPSEQIISRCRARYARPLDQVEAEWLKRAPGSRTDSKKPKAPNARPNIQGNISEQAKRTLFDQLVEELSQPGSG